MKLRSLILIAAGVVIGVSLSRKMREDDPAVVHGPMEQRAPANPTLRLVTGSAQRLADAATDASLGAIRKARGAIRERLAANELDDAAWN
jgi:hypothetical protein